jgi:hypothetical protein
MAAKCQAIRVIDPSCDADLLRIRCAGYRKPDE